MSLITISDKKRAANQARPTNELERHLIERIAILQARLNRCVWAETRLLELALPNSDYTGETYNVAAAAAFLDNEKAFMSLSRYEARIYRQNDQAVKQLLAIRRELARMTKRTH